MACAACSVECQRFGKHRNGLRRFRCPLCRKTYAEPHKPALEGSYIPQERIVLALRLLGDRVNFAQLIKVYKAGSESEARYSPAEVASTEVVPVMGNPDTSRICPSIVERKNLTMRMQVRRLTRLTNGFSKKWENLWAALCLHFAYYNFCRIHSTIRVTPAMEAGLRITYGSLRTC